jgi:O-antigen ligase
MFGFGLLLVLLTGSRGPLVAIVPTFIVFTLLVGSKRTIAAVLSIAVLILAVSAGSALPLVTAYMSDSISFGTVASSNVFSRLDLTTRLLDLFEQNPVFGFGPGMIQKIAEAGSMEFRQLAGLENQYAAILAEGGILAGATYLFFVVSVFSYLLRMYKNSYQREMWQWSVISLVLFTYIFSGALFANFLVSPIFNIVMAVFAISVALHETSRNSGPQK